jgi:hypothetical protein
LPVHAPSWRGGHIRPLQAAHAEVATENDAEADIAFLSIILYNQSRVAVLETLHMTELF